MWEYPLKLHAKTAIFHIMDLRTPGFCYLQVQGSQTQSPKGNKEIGRGLLMTSTAPPALDAASSTTTQLSELPQSIVSLPGFPDHDVRKHSLPQLTCHIQLQSYWAAVFWLLEQHGVSVSATCLLRK